MPRKTPAPTAHEIMRPHPGSVKENADIHTLAVIFMQHGFRHLPVTTGHIPKGMVSHREVLKALIEHYNRWTQKAEDERAAPDIRVVFTPRYIIG